MSPKRLSEKIAPQQNNMPFYWEIKRRARLLSFIVLGVASLYAAWRFAPLESGARAFIVPAAFIGVAVVCFVMAALALAGLRREVEEK